MASRRRGGSKDRASDLGTMSVRGVLAADEGTNTPIVRDTQACLDAIRRIIQRLDVPVE